MTLSRRQAVRNVAVFGAALVSLNAGGARALPPAGAQTRPANGPFGYCLNTSTIRGNKLDIVSVVNAAAKAGFHAIEPWMVELDAYTSNGGALKDLGKRIADAGLTVEGAIAFNSFLDDDDARRAASMEETEGGHGQGGANRRSAHRRAAGQQPRRRQPEQHHEVLPRGA